MAVYVDDAIWDWHGRKWCHLLADNIDELHRFARRLRPASHLVSRARPRRSAPHYDLTAYERALAIKPTAPWFAIVRQSSRCIGRSREIRAAAR